MARQFRFSVVRPPFRVLAEHLAQDDSFLDDARAILAMDETTVEALGDALAADESFLDRSNLERVLHRFLPAEDTAKDVSRTISRMADMLRDADEPLGSAVRLLKEAICEHSTKLEQEDRRKLGDRIEKLSVLPQGLTRQHKAEQLAEATGRELEQLQILCDLRPVLTEDRRTVEGAIPITTLTLQVDDAGTSSTLEIRMTERQVIELCEKAEFARTKLETIKRMLEEKSIVMPRTSATVAERTEE